MPPDYAAILSWHRPPDRIRHQAWLELLEARGYGVQIVSPQMIVASPDVFTEEKVGGSSVVFVGSTFSRSPIETSGTSVSTSIATMLERVISSRWGSYVALASAPGGIMAAMRDPSGSPATYYVVLDNNVILSTRLDLIEAISGRRNLIDDDGLAAELLFPGLRGRRTSVGHVKELLPGEALIVSPDGMDIKTIWSPGKYLSSSQEIGADEDPAPELRNTVNWVVETLCEHYDRVLITLSGGLDSSILAVAGRDKAESLSLLNLVSGSGSGDERRFAQALADHVERPLEVRPVSVEDVCLARSAARTRPRPTARAFTQSVVMQTNEFAKRVSAQAIINGHGGDNVFCYLHSAAPASELGWRNFFRSVADIAAVTDCSIPHIAFRALQHHAFRRRAWRWSRDTSLLARSVVILDQKVAEHPWLAERHQGAGKRAHIAALMNGFSFVDYLDEEGGAPFVYPLLSQPVVETCLRIPAWMWFDGGINRAPVRRAYASMLPEGVLRRTAKGAFSNFTRDLYRSNFKLIREMLLDGYLCRAGIVDRPSMEAALQPDTPAYDTTYNRLLRFVDLEAWVASRSKG